MTSKDERMKDYEFYNDFVPALGGAPDPDGANVLVGIAYETARMFNGFLARIERDDLDASPVTDQLLREAYALLTLIPPDREWTKKVLFQNASSSHTRRPLGDRVGNPLGCVKGLSGTCNLANTSMNRHGLHFGDEVAGPGRIAEAAEVIAKGVNRRRWCLPTRPPPCPITVVVEHARVGEGRRRTPRPAGSPADPGVTRRASGATDTGRAPGQVVAP